MKVTNVAGGCNCDLRRLPGQGVHMMGVSLRLQGPITQFLLSSCQLSLYWCVRPAGGTVREYQAACCKLQCPG